MNNPSSSRSITNNYLLITGLYTLSASLIWGVNTLFLLDAGLELFQVFLANAVFTGSMALFELPTGVVADTRGRRVSFLLSLAVLALGTSGYIIAGILESGLFVFMIMSALLGLGFTFYSGALEAWLVDALEAAGFEGGMDQIFARAARVSGAAMLLGSIGGGLLGSISLSLPFLIRSIMLVLLFILAFYSIYDQGFQPQSGGWKEYPQQLLTLSRASINHGWNNQEIRLILLAGLVQASFMAWGFYAWQPYFLELLGQNLTWVAGIIAALIAGSSIIGNSVVEWFSKFCGRRTTLLLWGAGISTLALIGVGLTESFWIAVALYLLASGASGVTMPVRQAYIHNVTPSSQRATVISFDSLLSSGSSMLGQSGLGYLSQKASLGAGYIVGGAATIFVIPLLVALRGLGQAGDLIVGKAGKNAACPAQGLPELAGVDSEAGMVYIDSDK
jgi:MFS family permease